MDLRGKTALVTGAAAGIGRATVLAFARKGVRYIHLLDLERDGLEATANQASAAGAEVVTHVANVTDSMALERIFRSAAAARGLDIVFNNAGIVSGPPAFPETPIGRIEQVVAINLTSVIVGTRIAAELMRERGGAIVNTSSTGGLQPFLSDATYAATKAGVLMLTQSCADLKVAFGIRVNAVCPGVTQTPILAKTGGGKVPDWVETLMNDIKILQPEDIAAAVVSLIEDDTKAGEYVVVRNEPILKSA